MFFPPRVRRLPLSGRISEVPKLTFIFRNLLVELFLSLLQFSLLVLPVVGRPTLLPEPAVYFWSACVSFRGAHSGTGHPKTLMERNKGDM